MKLTKAKKDALLHHYGGDLEAATKFLNNVLKAVRKLKPSQKQVTAWLEQGITNPDWLMEELSDEIKKQKKEAAAPTPQTPAGAPDPEAPDPPDPDEEEAPPPSDDDAPKGKKQSGWDF